MAAEVEADSPVIYNNSHSIPGDVLEDLCSRFLINIPEEERKDVVRLCFQIELAHWFYIDFYRQERTDLPGCGIKEFTRIIFNHFPFLNKTGENVDQIFANWRKYKLKVPVFGAILINQTFDKCLLVQPAMSKTSWGFPKGKVNKDEDEFDCAIREVYEETGFDMRSLAHPDNYIEHKINDHPIRLYVVPGVPENTQFQPQTRGEIRDIQWFEIQYLPSHKNDTTCTEYLNRKPSAFFMVIPFVKELRKRMSFSLAPRPSSQNTRTSVEEMASPKSQQLQKLLDKEDARLESEKKQAAAERRRKLQQEKFLAQHALSHPLREHHQKEQERLRTSRGYQSPVNDRDPRHVRGSPVSKEQEEMTSPIKILQRPDRASSPRDKRVQQELHDHKSQQNQNNPFQQLLDGRVDISRGAGMSTYGPFSPIYHAPISPYGISPAHPMSRYPGANPNLWQPNQGVPKDQSLDPLLKLRLLSATASSVSSAHPTQSKTAVQEDNTCESGQFLFNAPAFLNFKFDYQAILEVL